MGLGVAQSNIIRECFVFQLNLEFDRSFEVTGNIKYIGHGSKIYNVEILFNWKYFLLK